MPNPIWTASTTDYPETALPREIERSDGRIVSRPKALFRVFRDRPWRETWLVEIFRGDVSPLDWFMRHVMCLGHRKGAMAAHTFETRPSEGKRWHIIVWFDRPQRANMEPTIARIREHLQWIAENDWRIATADRSCRCDENTYPVLRDYLYAVRMWIGGEAEEPRMDIAEWAQRGY